MAVTKGLREYCGEHRYRCYLLCVLAAGFFLRLFYIGNIPGNTAIYVDEAYSGYESWCMVHFGHDSMGYVRPVYLETWGSGMSVMASLVCMPFIALFGLTTFAVRLPRAVVGCLGLLAFYGICKETRGKKFALYAVFVMALMPWDIMMSRWGLDCNYLYEFVLFATYFLVRAVSNQRFLVPAMLFYGLSLYCYAAGWTVMPIIIVGGLLYLLCTRQIRFDRWLVISVLLFCVLAVPLLLFIAVNYDLLPQMNLGIVSIPKMESFRSDEISMAPKEILKRMYDTLERFISQDDGRVSNATPMFGLFYKFAYPLMFLGLGSSLYGLRRYFQNRAAAGAEKSGRTSFKSLKEAGESKETAAENGSNVQGTESGNGNAYRCGKAQVQPQVSGSEGIFWLWLLAGVVLGGLIVAYFNRINLIMVPITYFIALGGYALIEMLGSRMKYVLAVTYTACAIAFCGYYCTYADDTIAENYRDGFKDALSYAHSVETEDTTIHLISDLGYPLILFYDKVNPEEYQKSVQYLEGGFSNELSLYPTSFLNFDTSWPAKMGADGYPEVKKGDVYIAMHTDDSAMQFMQDAGMEISHFNTIAVGVAK